MRRKIFEKAKYLLDTKQVKLVNETDYSVSFQVGKYHVVGKYINHKLHWLCSCSAEINQSLCAHKIAAQTHMTNGKETDSKNETNIEGNS